MPGCMSTSSDLVSFQPCLFLRGQYWICLFVGFQILYPFPAIFPELYFACLHGLRFFVCIIGTFLLILRANIRKCLLSATECTYFRFEKLLFCLLPHDRCRLTYCEAHSSLFMYIGHEILFVLFVMFVTSWPMFTNCLQHSSLFMFFQHEMLLVLFVSLWSIFADRLRYDQYLLLTF